MEGFEALEEVTERTRELARHLSTEASLNGFRRMHIQVPRVRKAVASGYSFFALPRAEVVAIWDHIWEKTEWYEVAHQALYYYQGRTLAKEEWNRLHTWIDRCDCWEHCDDLSKIYARVVEENPAWILPLYETWNQAESPWKRRRSVVGLIEYARKRKQVLPFPDLIRFIHPLLDDAEYYVQKGVGWTLREIYNVYPHETLAYLEEHAAAISPEAFPAATAKLRKHEKDRVRALRRGGRRSV